VYFRIAGSGRGMAVAASGPAAGRRLRRKAELHRDQARFSVVATEAQLGRGLQTYRSIRNFFCARLQPYVSPSSLLVSFLAPFAFACLESDGPAETCILDFVMLLSLRADVRLWGCCCCFLNL
jgi:hypothetical protein